MAERAQRNPRVVAAHIELLQVLVHTDNCTWLPRLLQPLLLQRGRAGLVNAPEIWQKNGRVVPGLCQIPDAYINSPRQKDFFAR